LVSPVREPAASGRFERALGRVTRPMMAITGRITRECEMSKAEGEGDLRSAIEATRLGFGLTEEDVVELVRGAVDLNVAGICIPPLFVAAAARALGELTGARPELVTVANFPTGDDPDDRVLADVVASAREGADHVDLVVPGRMVRNARWGTMSELVRSAVAAAAGAVGNAVPIKVILETAALSEDEIRGAGSAAVDGGAAWLKTSTGFHSGGGATVEAVRLLRSIAPAEVGVKASGGIRTLPDALRMIEAGADRIGTSAERAILGGS
jgi:deoxyribose-phosphate aldolase